MITKDFVNKKSKWSPRDDVTESDINSQDKQKMKEDMKKLY